MDEIKKRETEGMSLPLGEPVTKLFETIFT